MRILRKGTWAPRRDNSHWAAAFGYRRGMAYRGGLVGTNLRAVDHSNVYIDCDISSLNETGTRARLGQPQSLPT